MYLYMYMFVVYNFIFSIFLMVLSMIFFLKNEGLIMEWLFMEVNSMNVEFLLFMDWVSILFISIVMLIFSMILLYSISYMNKEKFLFRYFFLMKLFVFSMILMIISPNIFSIMFGWDGLGLVSFCLVVYYQNYMSYNSGMLTVLLNRLGDVMILMVIGMMMMYGSWNMQMFKNMSVLMIMLMLASMTKSAQIPFSSWLPSAMAAPTPVSALVHSSTLVTAGVYLMIRFNKFLMENKLSKILMLLSVLTMFMSGLMALFEYDLKKIIALSTLSQLGLMMMTLSLELSMLSFYHLLTHAIFKSLLFMSVGIIIHLNSNNQDIRLMGNLKNNLSFTLVSFILALMALMGFPFFSGFYSKDLIMEMVYMSKFNMMMYLMSLISLMFTVMYSIRLIYFVFLFESKMMNKYLKEDKVMNKSMLILMIMSVFIGSILNWLFFIDYLSFLKLNMKMLTLIFMMMGIFLIMIFMSMNLMKMYYYIYFFSSMWFLNYMYMYMLKSIMLISEKIYNLEKNWMEYYSFNFFMIFMISEKMIMKKLKLFMMIFWLMLFILILME